MHWLLNLLTIAQVICALGVIILVLLQHGKGADMGAAFGSGASGSLFGASGSANFLSRLTAAFAFFFFVSTLGLAFMANRKPEAPRSVMEGVVEQPAKGVSDIPTTILPAPAGASGNAADVSSQKSVPAGKPSGQAHDVPK